MDNDTRQKVSFDFVKLSELNEIEPQTEAIDPTITDWLPGLQQKFFPLGNR
jgi:hypothetical protein